MRTLRTLLAGAALLAGCPEERPGARLEVPAARVPPAVPVEAAPATAPAERPPATAPTSGR